MSKKSLFLTFSLSAVVTLAVSSCHKDGVFKSEQQTDTKSTQSSIELTNLQGPGNKDFSSIIETFRPKFELSYILFKSFGDQNMRLIGVKFNDLAPAISKSNKYYVELRNYYEKSNNVLERRDIGVIKIRDDAYAHLWGSSKFEYDDLFSDEGTGNGELRFYLIRKENLMNMILSLVSIKYTKVSKPMFDDYTFRPHQNKL